MLKDFLRIGGSLFTVFSLIGCSGGGTNNNSAPNNPPQISGTSFSTNEDTDLIANVGATDSDGDTVVFSKVSDVQHGILAVLPSGAVTYTPSANFNGSDQFTIAATDSRGARSTAQISITIVPVNDPPVIRSNHFSLVEDTTFVGNIFADDVDGDAYSFSVPNESASAVSISSFGQFTLNPPNNVYGETAFRVIVTDSKGASSDGFILVTIAPVNDAPVANPDLARTAPGVAVDVPVVANDLDIDGDVLQPILVGAPAHGIATVKPSGVISFLPDPGFAGTGQFNYEVSDPSGAVSAVVPVTVIVEPQQAYIYVRSSVNGKSVVYDNRETIRILANVFPTSTIPFLDISANGRTFLYQVMTAGAQSWYFADLFSSFDVSQLALVTQQPPKLSADGESIVVPGGSGLPSGVPTTELHFVKPYDVSDQILNTGASTSEQIWDFAFAQNDQSVFYISHAPNTASVNAHLFGAKLSTGSAASLLPVLANGDSFYGSPRATADARYLAYLSQRSNRIGVYVLDTSSPGSDSLIGPDSGTPCNPCITDFDVSSTQPFAAYALDGVAPATSVGYIVNLASKARVEIGPSLPIGARIGAPLFSPDGQHVLVRIYDGSSVALYEANASSPSLLTRMSSLLSPSSTIRSMQYSPDGKIIVYVADGGSGNNIFLVTRSSPGVSVQLNANLGTWVSESFAISPDSTTIGYIQSPSTGQPESLYLVDKTTPGNPLKAADNVVVPFQARQPFVFAPKL